MPFNFISIAADSPPGFRTGPVLKKDLLTSPVAIYAAKLDDAIVLLDDFCQRVSGLVITPGKEAFDRVGPLLWHIQIPPNSKDSILKRIEIPMTIVEAATEFRENVIRGDKTISRIYNDLSKMHDGYKRVAAKLQSKADVLREAKDYLEAILVAMPDLLLVINGQQRIIDCRGFCAEFGNIGAPKNMVGQSLSEIMPPDALRIVADSLIQAVRHGHHVGASFCWNTNTGSRWFELSIAAQGGIGCPGNRFMILMRDITDRKRIEEELKSQNLILATQQEVAIDGILVVGDKGQILSYNQRFASMWGIPPQILAAKSDELAIKFVTSKLNDPQQFIAKIDYLYNHSGETSYDEIVLKDGKVFERYSAPMVAADGQIHGRVWYFRDISERKSAENKVVEQNRFLELLLNHMPNQIFWKDTNLVYLGCNKEFAKVVGEEKPEDIIGKTDFDFHRNSARAESYRQMDRKVIDSDSAIVGVEEKYDDAHGNEGVVLTSKVPIKDNNGNTLGILGICVDISERKKAEAEKEKLQNQLAQAQKMETVGRLAGGIAHDFNNMLGVIIGHAEMTLEEIPQTHPLRQDMEGIHRAALRSVELTRRLLAFARQDSAKPVPLDLNSSIDSMLKMLQRLIGEDIQLIWRPGHDLWQVFIDSGQMDQILANLSVNARDAIVGAGTLTIETMNVSLDSRNSDSEFSPGDYVMLAVSDTGEGMDEETIRRIFDPFFTTKEKSKGTGLGLSIVYGAVKQNGGFIEVNSQPGRGATFKIYLPRAGGDEAVQVQTISANEKSPTGSETILMVEDEEMIRKINKTAMEKLGYNVLATGEAEEALAIVKKHRGPIHLLLSDVVMPGMNGKDLADQIKQMRPEIKILFVSGYSADIIASHNIGDDIHFLQKPFSSKTLGQKIRDILADKNSGEQKA